LHLARAETTVGCPQPWGWLTLASEAARHLRKSRREGEIGAPTPCFFDLRAARADPGTAAALTVLRVSLLLDREAANMTWETPAYSDVRFGFEVTMYISNR